MIRESVRRQKSVSNIACFLSIFLALVAGITSVVILESLASRFLTWLLVGLLGLLVFGPIAHRLVRRSLDLVEPGIWFGLFYFAHFGVRALYDLLFGSSILGIGPAETNLYCLNVALIVSIIAIAAFWVGYHAPLGKSIGNSVPVLPRQWKRVYALQVAMICIVIGWALRIFLIFYQVGGINAWIQSNKYELLAQGEGTVYLNILGSLATVGLFILLILGKVVRSQAYLSAFWVLVWPELGFRILGGSRAQLVFLLFGYMVTSYMLSERGQKAAVRYGQWAALLIILLVFLFPVLSIVRAGFLDPGEVLERASVFWKDPLSLFELLWARQHGLDSLALVLTKVPSDEPYVFGLELSLLLVSWIPRAVWPEKPVISVGKIFYERFYPPIFHEGTSVAVTLPGGFYWGFGLVGVIAGMVLIGVLWRFFFEYLVRPRGNLSNVLALSIIFPTFFIMVEQTIVSLFTMHLFQFLLVASVALLIGARGAKKGEI